MCSVAELVCVFFFFVHNFGWVKLRFPFVPFVAADLCVANPLFAFFFLVGSFGCWLSVRFFCLKDVFAPCCSCVLLTRDAFCVTECCVCKDAFACFIFCF